jgi:hypothetical protein
LRIRSISSSRSRYSDSFLVEAELVDDPRHARPREDLRGHQMQTLVDIALRDTRLDEIPDTACGSTSTVA